VFVLYSPKARYRTLHGWIWQLQHACCHRCGLVNRDTTSGCYCQVLLERKCWVHIAYTGLFLVNNIDCAIPLFESSHDIRGLFKTRTVPFSCRCTHVYLDKATINSWMWQWSHALGSIVENVRGHSLPGVSVRTLSPEIKHRISGDRRGVAKYQSLKSNTHLKVAPVVNKLQYQK